MKLYSTVRVLRGVALGAATGNPASAIVSEVVSVLPLYKNMSSTLGGILALANAGNASHATLDTLERPMRENLEWETFLLVLTVIAIFLSNAT